MAKLSEEDIAKGLAELQGWARKGVAIEKTWKFAAFKEALAFINRVAELAEAANHHPDIYNSWRTVRLRLTTYDEGALTSRDFRLAKQIDALR
jgi:4a-hydroxytetrahydrobiopterin dehydratase